MHERVAQVEDSAARQEVGTVSLVEGVNVMVRVAGATLRARRAVGCLVAPASGDLVLIAVAARGAWVLSVLERSVAATTRLSVEGDVELAVDSGRLTVRARDGVDVVTPAALSAVTDRLDVQARQAEASFEGVRLLGGLVELEGARVRVVAEALEQTVDRLTQRLGRAYRFIEGIDQLRAGGIDYVARRLLEMHGEHTSVSADGLVKIDGGQVHLG